MALRKYKTKQKPQIAKIILGSTELGSNVDGETSKKYYIILLIHII